MRNTKLSIVGDISLNDKFFTLLEDYGPFYPFDKIKSEFAQSDIVTGNLESPFVPDNRDPEFRMKTPLKAHPQYVEGLKRAGFNILNLSNNHILDYGESGAHNTQNILNDYRIEHFGYGANKTEAKDMKILFCNSVKIGFVGYTDVVIDSPFYAGNNTRGIAPFDINTARKETVLNKKKVDILVVNLHWGIEYFHLPTPEQISNAHTLVDYGADIIIGHHPHVIQGIERYNKGIIAYSLGNFIFADISWEWSTEHGEKRRTLYELKEENSQGIILHVMLNKNGLLDYSISGIQIYDSGQVRSPCLNAENRSTELSKHLDRNDYPSFFQRELRAFKRKMIIGKNLKRLKRLNKLRPKHLQELKGLLFQWVRLK